MSIHKYRVKSTCLSCGSRIRGPDVAVVTMVREDNQETKAHSVRRFLNSLPSRGQGEANRTRVNSRFLNSDKTNAQAVPGDRLGVKLTGIRLVVGNLPSPCIAIANNTGGYHIAYITVTIFPPDGVLKNENKISVNVTASVECNNGG